MAGALQRLDDLELVFGKDAGETVSSDDARELLLSAVLSKDRVGDDNILTEFELAGDFGRLARRVAVCEPNSHRSHAFCA